MKANLFFANGIMPALASCFIAELQCQENDANVNVLCIEVNSHVKPEYYEVLDIVVAQCKYFQQIVRVNTEFSVMSVKRPISFLKKIAHYREIGNEAKKIIWPQMLENLTAVWAPTTSRLWPFFKKRGVKFNLIEHGIGEYCFASSYKKSTLKSRAMEYIAIVFGYGSTTRFDSIWLCSNAVKLSADSKIVQHNCASQFSEYVNNFWLQYQKAFPVPAQELRKIAYEVEKNASHVYLYLPSDEIRYELYEQFVNKQIMVLGLKNNASFIIKKHPGDTQTNYGRYLGSHGAYTTISELVNCYLPVEFVIKILNIKNVVGSCSSALFYLKSWQPDISIHIYNDFDEQFLKQECVGLKKYLNTIGLINKQTN